MYNATLSSSIQTAKLSGVNPERLQGMKALLFDDEEDFMSPREKSLLANKSLIADGVRETHLKQRFDLRKKKEADLKSLEYSLLSESISSSQSPNKIQKRSRLLKSTFVSEDRGMPDNVIE